VVGIDKITDAELDRWVREFAAGCDAYVCAMEELAFRARHPEYRVVA
jgi:hypothetical protein